MKKKSPQSQIGFFNLLNRDILNQSLHMYQIMGHDYRIWQINLHILENKETI